MSDTPQRIELCSTSDVDIGTAIKVETQGLVLAVFNVNDAFYVTDDVVECDFHNGAFNIRTGEVVAPPCMIPLKTYRTIVEDGKVFIEL